MIRIILKLMALPIIILLTIIQWMGVGVISLTSWIFRIFSSLFFLTAVLGLLTGNATGQEALTFACIAAAIEMIPELMEHIVLLIAKLNIKIRCR